MNKVELIGIGPEAIRDFLLKKGQPSAKKYYELLIAIILQQFCQNQYGKECGIAFEVKPGLEKGFPSKGQFTFDEVEIFLTKKIRQDTPVDVAITCGEKAVGFQLKFFKDGTTKSLVQYINGLAKEYAKTDTKLMLVIDGRVEFDGTEVVRLIETRDYPFTEIMFTYVEPGDRICIGSFWPKAGCDYWTFNGSQMVKLP